MVAKCTPFKKIPKEPKLMKNQWYDTCRRTFADLFILSSIHIKVHGKLEIFHQYQVKIGTPSKELGHFIQSGKGQGFKSSCDQLFQLFAIFGPMICLLNFFFLISSTDRLDNDVIFSSLFLSYFLIHPSSTRPCLGEY